MAKIIIIGGGVSGLSAGIYAQMSGHDATVCEMHSVAGGNLTAWRRGDYEIDNCIHWLTGTNAASPLRKLWEDLGALGDGIEVYRPESLYTCRRGNSEISLVRDLNELKNRMIAISPEDKKEIDSLVSATKLLQRVCHIGGDGHDEGVDAPSLLRIPALHKYYRLTAKELSLRFKHPLLRDFIASFWEDDFGALALVFVFAHFCGENGDLPILGSRGMAERMTNRFLSLGGELLLKKQAVKINCEKNMARSVDFADGSRIEADYIVLTVDPAVAFGKLLDIPMPSQIKELYDHPHAKRFSSIQCAFAARVPDLGFRGDLVVKVPREHRNAIGSDRIILREFSHEKSYAPEGMTVLQAMTFCDEDRCIDLISLRRRDRDAYLEFKKNFSDTVEEIISKNLASRQPNLKLLDVWTPATYKRYTASDVGSYMSFVLPSRMLPSRKSNRIRGLNNVILATQWQQCPGGLPIAAVGGREAIKSINRLEAKIHERSRAPQTVTIS